MTDLSQLSYSERRAATIPLTPEGEALAQLIEENLDEKLKMPRKLIRALIYFCGIGTVQAAYEETRHIEDNGGLMINNGKRRRTPGGTFFYLMQQQVTPEVRRWTFDTFRSHGATGQKKKNPASATSSSAKTEPFDWAQRIAYHADLIKQIGVANTVKVTLIGRPGAVQINNQTVTTTMDHVVKTASLPKGVPTPPKTPTHYTIFIGLKQWNKVKEAIESDQEDVLIIEGVATFDPELNGMAVFASNVTTKAREIAKRQPKPTDEAAPEAAAPPAPKPEASAPPAAPKPQPAPKRPKNHSVEFDTPPAPAILPEVADDDLPANIPLAERQKIVDLQRAVEMYRQKLAALEANPPTERPGYEMTRKLLQNAEAKLATLLKNYT